MFFERYLEEFKTNPFDQPFLAGTINEAVKTVNEKAKALAQKTEVVINLKPMKGCSDNA